MKKTLFQFAMVAIPKVLSGAGTIGMNLLLLRYLGPTQFGVLSLCMASILLGDSILGSSFDLGVLKLASSFQTRSADLALGVQRSALYVKFAGLLITSLLVALFVKPIQNMALG